MTNHIPAVLPDQVQIGTIPAFPVPDGIVVGASQATLHGLTVRLRWTYGEVSAVVFPDRAMANRWPGFRADPPS